MQIKPEDASFHMGKYNIQSLEGNYVVSNVNQFVIHPDWSISDDRSDADIAIAVLTKSISFTDLIKPICLWTASTSYEDLVGEKVIVAGWGKTETGELSARPRWIEMPVVSELNCLRSNRAFHELTSNRTFCAGDINNYSGPCHGDSGKSQSKSSRSFFLFEYFLQAALLLFRKRVDGFLEELCLHRFTTQLLRNVTPKIMQSTQTLQSLRAGFMDTLKLSDKPVVCKERLKLMSFDFMKMRCGL